MSISNPTQPIDSELEGVEVHGMTRSSFILKGALATAATLGVRASGQFVGQALAASAATELDILNFALTLEYLETNFYEHKAKDVALSGQAKSLAAQFGHEESKHVATLNKAIKAAGGTPVKQPMFVFPVSDQSSFLRLAYALENVGVGAYNGAGPALAHTAYLPVAGSIVQVEARHAAAMAVLSGAKVTPNGAFDKPLTKAQVLAKIKPLVKS